MADEKKSRVIIEQAGDNLRENVETIMKAMAPQNFAGAKVLVKPNMVGPSAPEFGHTTSPELLRAVVNACLDRNGKVMVGDNPGGINRNSHTVAEITGILDASEGCFTSISERVVEYSGIETGLQMVVSKAIPEADYIINLPVFKTHLGMMITGAIKNTFGYIAGACKARLHVEARSTEMLARAICDVFQVRPPDLNIIDAITAIEGNGPCHGGRLRRVGKLLASTDALAVDAVMARMMGVDPEILPAQKQALARGLGKLAADEIEIKGQFTQIPDFKMPVTFYPSRTTEKRSEIKGLYPGDMMRDRIAIKPSYIEESCCQCEDCVVNCPAHAIQIKPEFSISDECITCFCCVELCPEGALVVPDVAAFRHY